MGGVTVEVWEGAKNPGEEYGGECVMIREEGGRYGEESRLLRIFFCALSVIQWMQLLIFLNVLRRGRWYVEVSNNTQS